MSGTPADAVMSEEGPDAGVPAHYGDPLREQRLLEEGLAVVDQPQVRFSFTSAPKPALLTGVSEESGSVSDHRYLVMPVRLT